MISGPTTKTERIRGKKRMSCLWSKGTFGLLLIANVQCFLPARPHKTRHVRHDNIFPTKRTRLECASFSTNTVTIPTHPHIWLVKTHLHRQNRTDTSDSDSFCRQNTATFDVRAMDDNDEPRATEADHRTVV